MLSVQLPFWEIQLVVSVQERCVFSNNLQLPIIRKSKQRTGGNKEIYLLWIRPNASSRISDETQRPHHQLYKTVPVLLSYGEELPVSPLWPQNVLLTSTIHWHTELVIFLDQSPQPFRNVWWISEQSLSPNVLNHSSQMQMQI